MILFQIVNLLPRIKLQEVNLQCGGFCDIWKGYFAYSLLNTFIYK